MPQWRETTVELAGLKLNVTRGGCGRPDEVSRALHPGAVPAGGEVDLDEVRGGTCGAVREERGGHGVGANVAEAATGDVPGEDRDVARRLGDRERDVGRSFERPADTEVPLLDRNVAAQLPRGDEGLDGFGVLRRERDRATA